MENEDKCCEICINEERVKNVQTQMPKEREVFDIAELFKVLGEPTRIKILSALLVQEMCVCDITELLKMTQSAISHQLRLLKNAKLVKNRKQGKMVYYSLDDSHIEGIISIAMEHTKERRGV